MYFMSSHEVHTCIGFKNNLYYIANISAKLYGNTVELGHTTCHTTHGHSVQESIFGRNIMTK